MKRELNEIYYGGNNQEMHGFEIEDVLQQQQQQQQEPTDFDPMDDTDIWLNGNFSTDFSSFQDFTCRSSSSSTSNSLPTNESDPSSWAVLKSDVGHDFNKKIGDQECLGYMDIIDGDHEFLDPLSFFHCENHQQQKEVGNDQQVSIFQGDSELALMFFEWLKQNREYISAEDMRSIKLKRSTIESASKRLGSTKEGKKQLLRLILDWVEQHRLQKKQMKETEAINQQNLQNSAPYNFDPSKWMSTPAYNAPFPNSTPVMAGPIQGYIDGSYGCLFTSPFNRTMSGNASSPASEFNQLTDNATDVTDQSQALFSQYPYQLFGQNGGGSCATKEARKNRMARQRRVPSHHYRHQTQNQRQISTEQSVMMGGKINNVVMSQANNPGNWVYWPTVAATPPAIVQADGPQSHSTERRALQSQKHQKHGLPDKRQACRTEKNLKFLLQKVLKQSDVGNLGRIVLPKKEAESHLPQLESRDGISLVMEDIGTSRVWNMKYRFWPNNKSRMYLLENTGDFVRANGLQEGDFIVIYADIKCGKYLIRGVKVRQNGPKSDGNQPAKKTLRKTAAVTSSPVAQAVR